MRAAEMSYHFLFLTVGLGVVLVNCVNPVVSVGETEPARVDEDGVVRAAHFAEEELNKMSNDLYVRRMTDVIKAQKQVVEGMNYYLTIEMTPTECKKNDPIEELDSCKLLDKPEKQICDVVVNERLWVKENPRQLLKFSCENAHQK
ncbi:cystatin-1-like [Acanthaster planci]|uniref:Cystatin-1-like n=1 Tax=Acanthaster planci TaxID=133434 RepID=A0A8B7ZUC7_ACAPL|nr:cystatin-1-like [Acanthaster planci]